MSMNCAADIIDRLYKPNPSDKFEGLCQIVEETKLSEFEKNIIYKKLYNNTKLPRYLTYQVLTDNIEDYKKYNTLYHMKKFTTECIKNSRNIISFVSNYENDIYVDEYVKTLELLKTGKKWYLIKLFPHIKEFQLLDMFRNNFDYKKIKKLYYEIYDDRNKIMLSHVEHEEYNICQEFAFLRHISMVYETYFKMKTPLEQTEYYEDYKNLIKKVKLYYNSPEITYAFSNKYHALLSVEDSPQKAYHQNKVFEIQKFMYKKTKYVMSLHDILVSLYIKYNREINIIERVNFVKIMYILTKENYDVLLKLKMERESTCYINLIVILINLFKNIFNGELSKYMEDDFFNELHLLISKKQNARFCVQKNQISTQECIICLDIIEIDEIIIFCNNCKNVIGHKKCCLTYWATKYKCPTCRQ